MHIAFPIRVRCQLWLIALASLVLFSGCSTTMPNLKKRIADKRAAKAAKAEAALTEVPKGYDPLEIDLPERSLVEETFNQGESLTAMPLERTSLENLNLPLREGKKPEVAAKGRTPYDLAADLTQDIENPDELLEVKLNLDGEDLINVIQMFSYLLGETLEEEELAPEDQVEMEVPGGSPGPGDSLDDEILDEEGWDFEAPTNIRPFAYYLDPGVSGSVNFVMETEMTREEVWNLFQYILWLSGAYVSRKDGFVHIMPNDKMPKESQLFHPTPEPQPNVHVEKIRLYHLTASDVIGMIQPYMTDGAVATPIQHLNSILLVESPQNIVKIRQMVTYLDQIGETSWPQIAIQCRTVDSATVLEELQQILPIIGFGNISSDQGDGRSLKIISLDRMQVLLASAPTVEVLAEIRRWVEVLDRDDTGEQEQMYFYPVKYNRGEDLADMISFFFTETSQSASRASTSSSSSSPSSRSNSSATGSAPASSRRVATTSSRRSSNRDTERPETIWDVPVAILANESQNQLMIRTTPRAYATLRALLARLDTPPLQVLVQVLIAEITLDRDLQFGFQYAAMESAGGENLTVDVNAGTGAGNPYYSMFFNTPGVDSASALSSPGSIFSFITAVAGKSNTRVLNAPQLVVKSDETARINVGDSVPVNLGSTINSSTTVGNIQYRDTGIILDVTPHITANKLVELELSQEVSEAVSTSTGVNNSPTIQNRSIETSLVLSDGQTVLIGGLIKTKVEEERRGLPYVHRLPVVGNFLGAKRRNSDRTELLLMINVRVIDLESDLEAITRRYKASMRAIYEDLEGPLIKGAK